MPLLLNTQNRADRLVWVIVQLLAAHGIRGLTMRRIADASRLSTSSLVHHWGSKERLLQVACFKTTRWRLDDIVFRTPREGLGAFVPQERESMLLAQAWLAWRELWRTDASLVRAGHAARGEERWRLGKAIAECCGEAVTEGDLDAGYALLEGLLIAVCAPVAPLPRDDAVALLERLLSGGRTA